MKSNFDSWNLKIRIWDFSLDFTDRVTNVNCNRTSFNTHKSDYKLHPLTTQPRKRLTYFSSLSNWFSVCQQSKIKLLISGEGRKTLSRRIFKAFVSEQTEDLCNSQSFNLFELKHCSESESKVFCEKQWNSENGFTKCIFRRTFLSHVLWNLQGSCCFIM